MEISEAAVLLLAAGVAAKMLWGAEPRRRQELWWGPVCAPLGPSPVAKVRAGAGGRGCRPCRGRRPFSPALRLFGWESVSVAMAGPIYVRKGPETGACTALCHHQLCDLEEVGYGSRCPSGFLICKMGSLNQEVCVKVKVLVASCSFWAQGWQVCGLGVSEEVVVISVHPTLG